MAGRAGGAGAAGGGVVVRVVWSEEQEGFPRGGSRRDEDTGGLAFTAGTRREAQVQVERVMGRTREAPRPGEGGFPAHRLKTDKLPPCVVLFGSSSLLKCNAGSTTVDTGPAIVSVASLCGRRPARRRSERVHSGRRRESEGVHSEAPQESPRLHPPHPHHHCDHPWARRGGRSARGCAESKRTRRD